MKESKEAIGQVQEFLRVWFCRRDPETAEQYLSGDIYMIGTGGEIASGLVAVRGYLAHESREHPEPFRIVFLHPQEQRLKADCACVSMEFLLQNKQYSWRLRTSMVLRMENDRWRICNIHASEAAGNQRSEKHYPQTLVLENLNCQRSELLDEAMSRTFRSTISTSACWTIWAMQASRNLSPIFPAQSVTACTRTTGRRCCVRWRSRWPPKANTH